MKKTLILAAAGAALATIALAAPASAAPQSTGVSAAFSNAAGTSYRTVVGGGTGYVSTTVTKKATGSDSFGGRVAIPAAGTTGTVELNGGYCLTTLWEDSPLSTQTCTGAENQQFTAQVGADGATRLIQNGKAVTARDTSMRARTLTLQDVDVAAMQVVTPNK
jgi:hypothetical protein